MKKPPARNSKASETVAELTERLRRRTVTRQRLAVAACLGHEAAIEVVGAPEQPRFDSVEALANSIVDHGKEASVRFALALLTHARDRMRLPKSRTVHLGPGLELAQAWVICPCADHVSAAEAWVHATHGDAYCVDEATGWSQAAIDIVTLGDDLDEDAWASSAAEYLIDTVTDLVSRSSERAVLDSVRRALLPWALGSSDPLKGTVTAARLAALRREGKAARTRRQRARASKARAPRTTAAFGPSGAQLEWNADDEAWCGAVELAGKRFEVSVNVEEADELDAAWRVVSRVVRGEAKLRRAAAELELLELYNESWNEGKPLGMAAFCRRLSLTRVDVSPDGDAEVCFADGELFAGHTILVSVNEDGEVDDASIAG